MGLKKVFDPIVDGLDMAMYMENCGHSNTVVPDAVPAQFHLLNWQSPSNSVHGPPNAQTQAQSEVNITFKPTARRIVKMVHSR